jgi:hypothetical protein
VVAEYMRRGGLKGVAIERLNQEIEKAKNDKTHYLYEVIIAHQKGHEKKAEKLFTVILKDALQNREHPLALFAFLKITMPFAFECFDRVKTLPIQENADDTFSDLARLGFANLQGHVNALKERASKSGKNKGKEQREKILHEWDKYSSKQKGAQAFARRLFNQWGGRTDENDKTIKGTPSIKTIANTVRDHLRNTPQS